MTDEPKEDFDTDDIHFDAEVRGRRIRIVVNRVVIEDKLRATPTKEQRLRFVADNRDQIVSNVAAAVGDLKFDTFRVGEQQLRGCDA